MEDAEKIKSTVDAYLETNDMKEGDLALIIQLDFDDSENEYTVDYTLTSEEKYPMEINTGFRYGNLAQAWENFIDQITEVNQKYRESNISHPHPEEYKGGKIGGNPAMSLRDAKSEI